MDPRREYFDFDQFAGTCTLNEVLDILCEDGEDGNDLPLPESVFIAPSDPAVLTDEDSGDEDRGGRAENLNSRQLTADAEVRFANATSNDDPRRFDDLVGRRARTWIKGELEPFLGPFPEVTADNTTRSAVDLFELFIDDDIIDMLVQQSNQYALWKNATDLNRFQVRASIYLMSLQEFGDRKKRQTFHPEH